MKTSPCDIAGQGYRAIHPGFFRLFLILLLLGPVNLRAAPKIVIDTGNASLSVLQDGKLLLQLEQIAIGRFGATAAKQRGDGRTPVGKYKIGWIKRDSAFRQFIGINYPAPADAKRGLKQNLIDKQTHDQIMAAHRQDQVPPQNTKLGGFLGIHALGQADLAVHRRYNWTRGCVATTNEQMDELLPWIEIGMPVEIR